MATRAPSRILPIDDDRLTPANSGNTADLSDSDIERLDVRQERVRDSLRHAAAERTEAANAQAFAAMNAEKARYVPAWRTWLVYAGGRWQRDPGEVQVTELAKTVGRQLLSMASFETTPQRVGASINWARAALSRNGIRNLIELARGVDGIPVDHEQLDANPWLFNVRNGTIDLRGLGGCRPARAEDLITMQAPVEFDAAATAPRFERAFVEWFPDDTKRHYLQRLTGAAMVGTQRDHVFVIHYGIGRNGKGTFVRSQQRLFGPYAATPHLSLIVQQKHAEHDTVKADLFRARLAVASESERRVTLAEASIKNLTGGDRITCRRMRENPWSFDPSHSLWLQTNYLPVIGGRDRGIWSRLRVVRWESNFEGIADPTLDDQLAAELSGILNWAIAGCQLWLEYGLAEPDSVIQETLAYRANEDVFARFAAVVGLRFAPGLNVETAQLNQLVDEWAEAEGIRLRRGDFADWLKEHGAEQRRATRDATGRNPRVWAGVGVLTSSIGTEPREPYSSGPFRNVAEMEDEAENSGSGGSLFAGVEV